MDVNEDTAFEQQIAEATRLLNLEDAAPEATPEVPEVTPEVPEAEPIPETEQTQEQIDAAADEAEKLPHGESSRLGRKVKRIEDKFSEAMDRIDALVRTMQGNQANPQQAQPDPIAAIDPDDAVSTNSDVLNLINLADKRRQMESQKTAQAEEQARAAYFGRFERYRDADPDLHDAIYEEMLKNYNVKTTGKPDVDADFNYSRARNAVLFTKLAEVSKPKPNVLGKAAPSVNIPSANARPSGRTISLSPEEQELADAFGFKDEELQKILGNAR